MNLTTPTLPTTLAEGGDLMSHVLPHEIFSIGGFTVTNHHLMTVISAALVLITFLYVASRVKPRGHQVEEYVTKGRLAQTFEVMLEFFRNEVTRPALGSLTDKYVPFVWTTFFFILFCNVLGLVPFGPVIELLTGGTLVHWGGTATANINITAALAIVAFFMIHVVGVREQGAHYFAHFAPVPLWPFMKGGTPGMLPIAALLVVLEIVGSFVKPFALAVRLFANMVAGHLVLAALIGLIFMAGAGGAAMGYGTAVPAMLGATALSLLELFVAFLQAFIFTFLTVLFIAAGVGHHDEHEHEEETHGERLREPAYQASPEGHATAE